MDRGHHNISFDASFVEIEHMYCHKTETKKKVTSIFIILKFFLDIRRWIYKLSFDTSFVKNGWEFVEVFDLRYRLGSTAERNAI